MSMTTTLATKRATISRRRSGRQTAAQVVVALVAAFIALGVGGPAPATAQIVPPGPTDITVEQCIEAEMDEGSTEAAATRQCVNDSGAFDRCMAAAADAEVSVNEALDRCVAADADLDETSPTVTTTVASTTTPSATTQEVTADSDGSPGVPPVLVAMIALVAAAAGASIALAVRRATSTPPPVSAPVIAPPPVAPHEATTTPAPDPDRANLVMALIETADVTTSDAVRISIVQRLQAAGVSEVVVPAGVPFDPTAHRGVQAEPAPRPDLAGTVVRTDRPGWNDRETVLRAPEVIVYRESET